VYAYLFVGKTLFLTRTCDCHDREVSDDDDDDDDDLWVLFFNFSSDL